MNLYARPLSIEEIEQIAVQFKEDLNREMKRLMRRKAHDDAMHALVAEEYIDDFVGRLRVRSGSQLGLPPRARPIQLNVARAARRKRESE